jgi:hypothetical protein
VRHAHAHAVPRVPSHRQEWEAALWSASAAGVTTDRNEHHKRHFDNYAEVPRQLGHVVEVGCGPFTQLQTILPGRPRPASITLVDPLLESYARTVRGCPYSRGKLLGNQLALVASPLEELELPQKADTLVMVSLLQSVRDVPRALQAPRARPATVVRLYSPLPRATQAPYNSLLTTHHS